MRDATIYDIASELEISAATVSRAIANNPRISLKTKKLVNEKARELGYRPNKIASNLRSGRGNTIGVILPQIQRHFFASVIHGMEVVLNAHGYNLVICQSNEGLNQEKKAIETLINNRVDGILISNSKETYGNDHLKLINKSGIPFVQFDRIVDDLNSSNVVNDNFSGAYEMVSHLIDQGYSRIAHLSGPQNLKLYRDRLDGYACALEAAHIPFDQSLILEAITIDTAEVVAGGIMQSDNPPDAFFAASDLSALGALNYLKCKGYNVPQEVGVAGFGNEPLTEMITPSLTTLEQFGVDMGKSTSKLLLNSIEGNKQSLSVSTLIKPKLIIRESTNRSRT